MTRAWLALSGIVLLWGMFYLGVDRALDSGWSGGLLNACRFGLAALVLAALAAARGQGQQLRELPRRRPLRLLLLGLTETGAAALINLGQLHVASGLASVLQATMPLFAALLALLPWLGRQHLGRNGWLGLLISIAGVGVLYLPLLGSSASLWGASALLVSAGLIALEAHLVLAWFRTDSPLVLTAWMMAWTALLSGLQAGLLEHAQAGNWWYMLALALGSNLLAFLIYFWLIQRSGPTFAGLYAPLLPVVAVLAGWLFNREQLSWYVLWGAVLCIGGAWAAGREVLAPTAASGSSQGGGPSGLSGGGPPGSEPGPASGST